MLDAFHVIKLGTDVVDQVRRRVQQDTLGHRGHRDDPLYRIRNVLRAGAEKLTDRQWTRLETALDARPEHEEVGLAWSVAQRLRLAYRHPQPAEGRKIAEQLVASLPSCPVPELARLGRTLRRWREALLAFVRRLGPAAGRPHTGLERVESQLLACPYRVAGHPADSRVRCE